MQQVDVVQSRGSTSPSGDGMIRPRATAVVIDDDEDIRALIAELLRSQGFDVHEAPDGVTGVALVRALAPAIITVDIVMPGIDGFETVERIRAVSDASILMISARDEELAVVEALRRGADDYVLKPYRTFELRARIDALLRRSRANASAASQLPVATDGTLRLRTLQVDPARRRARVGAHEVSLTRSEFDILVALLVDVEHVVSKEQLAGTLRTANGIPAGPVTHHERHAVEVHVMNLRRKLTKDGGAPVRVETVRGLGYRMT